MGWVPIGRRSTFVQRREVKPDPLLDPLSETPIFSKLVKKAFARSETN
jgi:hypothetical protein